VNDPYQALLVASQRKPDLFLIDYHLPYMNGIELYNKLHIIEGLEEVPAIIMSVMSEQWKQELQDHHLPFLEKPFAMHALLEIVQHSLDTQEKRATFLTI
jgi:DNA-binding NtrC family response regulator